MGVGGPGGDRIVHANNCVADAPARLVAVAVTAYTPARVGFPETVPVAFAIDRPDGRPDAPYVRARPVGSVALSCNRTF